MEGWHFVCVQIPKTKSDSVNKWDRSFSEHMAASILHWVDLLLNALQSLFCIGSIFFWTHGSFYFELGRSSSERIAVSILYWVDLLLSTLQSLFCLVESDGNIQSQSGPLHSWYDDAMMIHQVYLMMCICFPRQRDGRMLTTIRTWLTLIPHPILHSW